MTFGHKRAHWGLFTEKLFSEVQGLAMLLCLGNPFKYYTKIMSLKICFYLSCSAGINGRAEAHPDEGNVSKILIVNYTVAIPGWRGGF